MKKSFFDFSNTYVNLPDRFFQRIKPQRVKNPKLLKINLNLAKSLGLEVEGIDKISIDEILCGNKLPKGAEPIAMAYAGHQFGNFVPSLGDGRAILLGEFLTPKNKRFDIQLKGAGITKFSRSGDGRAPLGPVIREYVVSEAMYHLGIPTTRSLSIIKSDDFIQREDFFPCGVLSRVASSHIRIGTFEYFNYRKDVKSLKLLADYTINRHFPSIKKTKNKYKQFLMMVQSLNAELVAKWMAIGFIHGVMNTDNTSISGETIDYGPCAFMDYYNPKQVYSYIDHQGRYSYINQGKIMFWNLSKFAESLIPILDEDPNVARSIAIDVLKDFPRLFENIWLDNMRKKFGFSSKFKGDSQIISEFLNLIEGESLDYTQSFRNLIFDNNQDFSYRNFEFKESIASKRWFDSWHTRLHKEKIDIQNVFKSMKKINPIYIPRNHILEKVINELIKNKSNTMLEKILELIEKPYTHQKNSKYFELPPNPSEEITNTFCGT